MINSNSGINQVVLHTGNEADNLWYMIGRAEDGRKIKTFVETKAYFQVRLYDDILRVDVVTADMIESDARKYREINLPLSYWNFVCKHHHTMVDSCDSLDGILPFEHYIQEEVAHVKITTKTFADYTKLLKEMESDESYLPSLGNYLVYVIDDENDDEYYVSTKSLKVRPTKDVFTRFKWFDIICDNDPISGLHRKFFRDLRLTLGDKVFNERFFNEEAKKHLKVISWDIETTGLDRQSNSCFLIGASITKYNTDAFEKLVAFTCIEDASLDSLYMKALKSDDVHVANCSADQLVIRSSPSESEMIIDWFQFLNEEDPDFIVGFNDSSFDWSFLNERMTKCIETNELGNVWSNMWHAFNSSCKNMRGYSSNNKIKNTMGITYSLNAKNVALPKDYSQMIPEINEFTNDGFMRTQMENIARLNEEGNNSFGGGGGNNNNNNNNNNVTQFVYEKLKMFTTKNIKISATTYQKMNIPSSDKTCMVDMMILLKQKHSATMTTSSKLNSFLEMHNLGSKQDMDYNEMFAIAKHLMNGNNSNNNNIFKSKSGFTYADVVLYCLVDAYKCHRLMYKTQVLDEAFVYGGMCNLTAPTILERANSFKINEMVMLFSNNRYSFKRKHDNEKFHVQSDLRRHLVDAAECIVNGKNGNNGKEETTTDEEEEESVSSASALVIKKLSAHKDLESLLMKDYKNLVAAKDVLIDENKRKQLGESKYEGAFVHDPIVGVDWLSTVTGLDFSSLYPSIMRTYNLSPDKVVDKFFTPHYKTVVDLDFDKETHPSLPVLGSFNSSIAHVEEDFTTFLINKDQRQFLTVRRNKKGVEGAEAGLIPELLDFLADERARLRVQLKKDNHRSELDFKSKGIEVPFDLKRAIEDANIRQLAVKVMMNTVYGIMGSKISGGSLYRLELAATITLVGRTLIKSVSKFINETKMFRVVYGDTDSVYVSPLPHIDCMLEIEERYKKDRDIKQLVHDKVSVTQKIVTDLNKNVSELLLSWSDGHKYLSMAYEEVLYPSALFSKKFYTGIKHEAMVNPIVANPDVVFSKGVAYVKRTTSEASRHAWMDIVLNNYFNYDVMREFYNRYLFGEWTWSDYSQSLFHDLDAVNPLTKIAQKVFVMGDRLSAARLIAFEMSNSIIRKTLLQVKAYFESRPINEFAAPIKFNTAPTKNGSLTSSKMVSLRIEKLREFISLEDLTRVAKSKNKTVDQLMELYPVPEDGARVLCVTTLGRNTAPTVNERDFYVRHGITAAVYDTIRGGNTINELKGTFRKGLFVEPVTIAEDFDCKVDKMTILKSSLLKDIAHFIPTSFTDLGINSMRNIITSVDNGSLESLHLLIPDRRREKSADNIKRCLERILNDEHLIDYSFFKLQHSSLANLKKYDPRLIKGGQKMTLKQEYEYDDRDYILEATSIKKSKVFQKFIDLCCTAFPELEYSVFRWSKSRLVDPTIQTDEEIIQMGLFDLEESYLASEHFMNNFPDLNNNEAYVSKVKVWLGKKRAEISPTNHNQRIKMFVKHAAEKKTTFKKSTLTAASNAIDDIILQSCIVRFAIRAMINTSQNIYESVYSADSDHQYDNDNNNEDEDDDSGSGSGGGGVTSTMIDGGITRDEETSGYIVDVKRAALASPIDRMSHQRNFINSIQLKAKNKRIEDINPKLYKIVPDLVKKYASRFSNILPSLDVDDLLIYDYLFEKYHHDHHDHHDHHHQDADAEEEEMLLFNTHLYEGFMIECQTEFERLLTLKDSITIKEQRVSFSSMEIGKLEDELETYVDLLPHIGCAIINELI